MYIKRKFRLLKDRFEHKAGTIVVESFECDYGLCSNDRMFTGIEHMLVTLDLEDVEDYGFTVPITDLEEI